MDKKTYGVSLNPANNEERDFMERLERMQSASSTIKEALRYYFAYLDGIELQPPESQPVIQSAAPAAIDYHQLARAITEGLINAGVSAVVNAGNGKPAALPVAEGREAPNDPLVGRVLSNNWDEM